MTAGHAEAAAKQLDQVTQLVSNDRVAAELLRMLRPPANLPSTGTGQNPTPQPPVDNPNVVNPTPGIPKITPGAPLTDAEANVPAVDPRTLVGSWKASRDDGSTFELNLTAEQGFNWKFSAPKQKPQELSGKYTVEKNVLALQQEAGGALVGAVTLKGDGAFNFKMLGGPPEDPGLNFSK